MQVIVRAMGELASVILTGFVGFFVGVATLLAGAVGGLLILVCSLATGLLLFMSLFCGLGWFFTHKAHELVNAGGFLIEAAIPFTLMVMVSYYREKLARALAARRARKAALRRLGGVHLAPRGVMADASYDP